MIHGTISCNLELTILSESHLGFCAIHFCSILVCVCVCVCVCDVIELMMHRRRAWDIDDIRVTYMRITSMAW
jgi:hypothetical protein